MIGIALNRRVDRKILLFQRDTFSLICRVDIHNVSITVYKNRFNLSIQLGDYQHQIRISAHSN